MIKTSIKRLKKNITCTYEDNVVQMTFYASHNVTQSVFMWHKWRDAATAATTDCDCCMEHRCKKVQIEIKKNVKTLKT